MCENSPSSRLKMGALDERDSIEIVHVGIFTEMEYILRLIIYKINFIDKRVRRKWGERAEGG